MGKKVNDYLSMLNFACEGNTLYIRNDEMNDDEVKLLLACLPLSVISLYLENNNIGDEGAVAIVDWLKANKSLKYLYLDGNKIGDEGAVAIGELLNENISPLNTLSLNNNVIGDKGASGIGEGLMRNNSMNYLYMDNNNISDKGASGIGEGLKENKSLDNLSLNNNKIGDAGAVAIIEALKFNNSLRHMELSGNKATDSLIIDSLMKNPNIRCEVNVDVQNSDSNQLLEAINSLSRMKQHSELRNSIASMDTIIRLQLKTDTKEDERQMPNLFLSLRNSNLKDGDAAVVAEFLRKNNSVSVVDLSHNHIGNEGMLKIAEALMINTSVFAVYLHGNDYGSSSIDAFQYMLDHNSYPRFVCVNSERLLMHENTDIRHFQHFVDEFMMFDYHQHHFFYNDMFFIDALLFTFDGDQDKQFRIISNNFNEKNCKIVRFVDSFRLRSKIHSYNRDVKCNIDDLVVFLNNKLGKKSSAVEELVVDFLPFSNDIGIAEFEKIAKIFPNLQILRMRGCNLGPNLNDLQCFTNLKYLYVDNNPNLTMFTILPSNLQFLSVSDCSSLDATNLIKLLENAAVVVFAPQLEGILSTSKGKNKIWHIELEVMPQYIIIEELTNFSKDRKEWETSKDIEILRIFAEDAWKIIVSFCNCYANDMKSILATIEKTNIFIDDRNVQRFNRIYKTPLITLVEIASPFIKVKRLLWRNSNESKGMEKPDVFIAHSGAEKYEDCSWINEELKKSNMISSLMDETDLKLDDDSITRMLFSHIECKIAYVVVSEEYLSKSWSMVELCLIAARYKQHLEIFQTKSQSIDDNDNHGDFTIITDFRATMFRKKNVWINVVRCLELPIPTDNFIDTQIATIAGKPLNMPKYVYVSDDHLRSDEEIENRWKKMLLEVIKNHILPLMKKYPFLDRVLPSRWKEKKDDMFVAVYCRSYPIDADDWKCFPSEFVLSNGIRIEIQLFELRCPSNIIYKSLPDSSLMESKERNEIAKFKVVFEKNCDRLLKQFNVSCVTGMFDSKGKLCFLVYVKHLHVIFLNDEGIPDFIEDYRVILKEKEIDFFGNIFSSSSSSSSSSSTSSTSSTSSSVSFSSGNDVGIKIGSGLFSFLNDDTINNDRFIVNNIVDDDLRILNQVEINYYKLTVGLFAKYTTSKNIVKIGFITAAHCFEKLNEAKSHNYTILTGDDSRVINTAGKVYDLSFENSKISTTDVAFVELNGINADDLQMNQQFCDCKESFSIFMEQMTLEADKRIISFFKPLDSIPKYSSHVVTLSEIAEMREDDRYVFKIGHTTGFTIGKISFFPTASSIAPPNFESFLDSLIHRLDSLSVATEENYYDIYYNQLRINRIEGMSSPLSQKGDSGSIFFQLKRDDDATDKFIESRPVGMLVLGFDNADFSIVTPLQRIIDSPGIRINLIESGKK